MPKALSFNMRLLAHHELHGFGGIGEGMALQQAGDARRILWLAHEAAPKNFTGVDVSDPEGGTPWSFFNYNWVEQVQVVSLGANAEYGEFTGVAANSIIRSGSNKFTGMAEYLTERKSWLADNTKSLSADLQKTLTPREINTYWDTTGQFGGPLAKDKLFFFGGFQYFKREDRPAGFTGDFTSESDPRTIGKLTWAAKPDVRVEGFVEYDKYNIAGRGASVKRPTTNVTALEPSP